MQTKTSSSSPPLPINTYLPHPDFEGNAAIRLQPAVIVGRRWYHLTGIFLMRPPISYLAVSNDYFLQCN
jgi:hypothetical protein